MPRPSSARKGGPGLEPERVAQPVQVGVAQHQRLYGPRDTSGGIRNFLGNLAAFAERREARRDRQLATQGSSDALAGTVDESLMGRAAYADAVNTANGAADGLNLRAKARATMERSFSLAREAGEEWDPEAAYLEATQEFTESDAFQVPAYRQAAVKELATLRAEMIAFGARQSAQAQLEEGSLAVSNLAFSQFRAGEFNPEALDAIGEESGLTVKEKSAAIAQGALSFLDQAETPEDIAAVDAWVSTLSDGQRQVFGDEIANARRVAENRVNQISGEEKLAAERRYEGIKRDLWTRARTGDLPLDELRRLEAAGEITPDDVTTYYKQTVSAQDAKLKELGAAQAEEAEIAFRRAVIENPTTFAGLSTKERNAVKEQFELDNAQAAGTLIDFAAQVVAADEAGNEAQIGDLRDGLFRQVESLAPYVETSRQLGFTPRWIKNYVGAAVDPSSPQFRAAAEVVTVLEAQYGDDVLSDVAEEPLAKIDAYRRLRDAGMPNDQAVELIASRSQITLPEARKAIRSDSKFSRRLDGEVKNLVESQEFNTGVIFDTNVEVSNGPYVKDVVADLAAIHYRNSGNSETAVEWASAQFKKSHQLIDGAWMPTEGIPRGFGLVLQENRDKVLKNLRSTGVLSDDEDFQILPLAETGATGVVGIFRKKEGLAAGLYPVTTKDGKPVEVDTFKLLQNIGVILDDARRQEGEEVLTKARALRQSRLDSLLTKPPIEPK